MFGACVARPRLESIVAGCVGGICWVHGHSGSGKSVLAAQVAASSVVSSCAWIDCSGLQSPEELCDVLARRTAVAEPAAMLLPKISRDLKTTLLELHGRASAPHALVLDNVGPPLAATLPLDELTDFAATKTACVIVTSRHRPESVRGAGVLLSASDLALTETEMLQLMELRGRQPDESTAIKIGEVCRGHAGIADGLVRVWGREDLGADLANSTLDDVVTTAIEEELSDVQVTIALAASIVGQGRVSDLTRLVAGATTKDVVQVAEVLPVLRLQGPRSVSRFSVHDALLEHFHIASADLDAGLLRRCIAELDSRGDCQRALEVLSLLGQSDTVFDWILASGGEALDTGFASRVLELIESLERPQLRENPQVLFLHARALRELGSPEAMSMAEAAYAAGLAGNAREVSEAALVLKALLFTDTSSFGPAAHALTQAVSEFSDEFTTDTAAIVYATLSACRALIGERAGAKDAAVKSMEAANRGIANPEVAARVLMANAALAGLVEGQWDVAARLVQLAARTNLSVGERTMCRLDLAAALAELGQLDRAAKEAREGIASLGAGDIRGTMRAAFQDTLAVAIGPADVASALELLDSSEASCREHGELTGLGWCLVHRAVLERASGSAGLNHAEEALAVVADISQPSVESSAMSELAASLLWLGAPEEAAARAKEAIAIAGDHVGPYYLLRSELVLAEIERREGRLECASSRLAPFREHVLSESSNWQIAMYCRAFPGLLGVLANALGVANLPAHLLRMIPAEKAEIALEESRGLLGEEECSALGSRLLGRHFEQWKARDGKPLCRIRLLGGLDVSVGARQIADEDWHKRKARLLFAMLAVRGGQEVAVEQVLDHLWPDMDESRARSNLYVTWAAVKSALMGAASRGAECPYIHHARGIYRLAAENTRLDVDEFDETLSVAKAAVLAGETATARDAYKSAAVLYRGDLLAGDLYDEWFASARERLRRAFCDAMLDASEWSLGQGEGADAAWFARRGISVDPLREDLYQAALRAYIALGERGPAVETYFQLRSQLAEELGLDPSAATARLYEQLLALDDALADEASA